jgi:hypothetical protein
VTSPGKPRAIEMLHFIDFVQGGNVLFEHIMRNLKVLVFVYDVSSDLLSDL